MSEDEVQHCGYGSCWTFGEAAGRMEALALTVLQYVYGLSTTIESWGRCSLEWQQRLLATLCTLYRTLARGHGTVRVSLRELYYRQGAAFASTAQLNQCVWRIAQLLRCPRRLLPVVASSRGFAAVGAGLEAYERWPPSGLEKRTRHNRWRQLPSRQVFDIAAEVEDATGGRFHYDLRVVGDTCVVPPLILIVEKYGIFYALMEQRVLEYLPPCTLLVTGCGQPSMAVRSFVAHAAQGLRSAGGRRCPLPVYVLVDYNPYGIRIAQCYRYGGDRQWLEHGAVATPQARWIGPFADDWRVVSAGGAAVSPIPLRPAAVRLARSLLHEAQQQGDEMTARELAYMGGPDVVGSAAIDSSPAGASASGTFELQTVMAQRGASYMAHEFVPRIVLRTLQQDRLQRAVQLGASRCLSAGVCAVNDSA
ncbi:hypothetical protein CDCA_CDCA14G3766 [Cyanidium caldarium]|uniref:Topoisomerase 6 subunit A/Spo11 TOPRIM domain-containing protein n=1 Tax=Cyanidium caldarium TaxID=2771 RepID=A0AAV9J033_CYACA|nr:hypothetical protein CDCA_CDCA14G3766 [Cyanidium caldarium]